MEFSNGCSLSELLISKKVKYPFLEAEVNLVIRQVVQGVKALYEKTIVHRDLNIKNVLIHFPELQPNTKELQRQEDRFYRTELAKRLELLMSKPLTEVNFEIKIADLGMARTLSYGFHSESQVGTPGYYAPELIIKEYYDHKIDVWGIANIFYNLMTKSQLFPG